MMSSIQVPDTRYTFQPACSRIMTYRLEAVIVKFLARLSYLNKKEENFVRNNFAFQSWEVNL